MTTSYDIAAYVWPSYHPDNRAKIFWPEGIGEWETVRDAKPKFPGHEQPRVPLWGFVNEADPDVMRMQIDAAADHGVNVFIYDWYWYDAMPFLEGCLNDGFLKAKNNSRMKFCIMWANHDIGMLWDRRNAGMKDEQLIWKGSVDREEFEVVAHRIIEKYFTQPNYYKIDGKPVFIVYELNTLIRGLGSIKKTRAALDWFRKEAAAAGFPGLELMVTLGGSWFKPWNGPGENIKTQEELVKQLGFDGVTNYQIVHLTDVDRDYNAIMKDVEKAWKSISKSYSMPYYAHVSVGWDNNPRHKMFMPGIVKNNTPANFEKALRMVKAYADARPKQPPFITLNSWNEWTETSYLQPCKTHGYGYLEAVKEVFV